jgi:hypothetical protein
MVASRFLRSRSNSLGVLGEGGVPETRLSIVLSGTPATEKAAGEALLQSLHDDRRVGAFGFTDEQMNVLRHDDVSDQDELIAAPYLLEDTQKKVAVADCSAVADAGSSWW